MWSRYSLSHCQGLFCFDQWGDRIGMLYYMGVYLLVLIFSCIFKLFSLNWFYRDSLFCLVECQNSESVHILLLVAKYFLRKVLFSIGQNKEMSDFKVSFLCLRDKGHFPVSDWCVSELSLRFWLTRTYPVYMRVAERDSVPIHKEKGILLISNLPGKPFESDSSFFVVFPHCLRVSRKAIPWKQWCIVEL